MEDQNRHLNPSKHPNLSSCTILNVKTIWMDTNYLTSRGRELGTNLANIYSEETVEPPSSLCKEILDYYVDQSASSNVYFKSLDRDIVNLLHTLSLTAEPKDYAYGEEHAYEPLRYRPLLMASDSDVERPHRPRVIANESYESVEQEEWIGMDVQYLNK